ncbi:hypothetical protein ABTO19_19050, partial [Acinetobacter baumannii]
VTQQMKPQIDVMGIMWGLRQIIDDGLDRDHGNGTAGVSVQTRRCSRIQGSAGLLGCENR